VSSKPSAPDKGFDPEAEQEVDFARYARMLARRWWLVAIGVVVGAVIGFLVSLGGTKVYSAQSTIYLGQPYNPSGSSPVLNLQTTPSAIAQIANSDSVDDKVKTQCKTTVESFRKGLSVQKVVSSTPAKGLAAQVNPLVTVTVQTSKGKVAACVANALARAAVAGIDSYPVSKLKNYAAQIAQDKAAINQIQAELTNPNLSDAVNAFLQTRLPQVVSDLEGNQTLLNFTRTVEMPKVMLVAREHQVTAQSSHNTVLIAAIIGLILGIIAALLWDRIVPSRNGS
jgi:capsular polysaccharide biosynthesis protein